MGQIDLGRVQGHSISNISRIASSGNVDTYDVKLDNNTSAGQFTVTNGVDGANGTNGRDGKDGAPGKDGTLISVNGHLVSTFNADNKSDLPIDSLSSSETKIPLSANMGRQLDLTKAPTAHASEDTIYGIGSATNYGHVKASSTTPLMNGTANLGTDNGCYAREGHIHPTDTSRAAKEHTHKVSDLTEGTLMVANGGTGRTIFPNGEILVGNGSNELTSISQANMSVGYAVSAGSAANATKADKATKADSSDVATRATQDANGNNIANTYLGTLKTLLLGVDHVIGGNNRTVTLNSGKRFSDYKYIIFLARDELNGNVDYTYCMVERKLLDSMFNAPSRTLSISRDGARLRLYRASDTSVYVVERYYNNLLTIYGVN